MSIESGYHKLSKEEDFESVLASGLRPSTPGEKQWLGVGIYFFLDPQGFEWAKKWPMKPAPCKRSGCGKGILSAMIDLSDSLDLRDNDVRNGLRDLLSIIKLKLTFESCRKPPFEDGVIFTALFEGEILGPELNQKTKVIIANFDIIYKSDRMKDSRVWLDIDEISVNYSTTQIQACVRDRNIIKDLKTYSLST